MQNLLLAEETSGYQTATDPSNTDKRFLIAGSQNVIITQQKKVAIRPGYTRLGAANTALTPIKNGWTWNTSTSLALPQRNYNGILEAYLGTVDGTAVNAWTQVYALFTTTAMVRPALTEIRSGGGWYDTTESIDVELMVQGDDSIFEWSGGVAIVASATTGQALSLNGNSASLTAFGAITGTAPLATTYNSLTGTVLHALVQLTTNPTDGQTLLLNINAALVTITFVAAIGAAAGNVLIAGTLAGTVTNLLGLLNAPGTTNANQVALSGGNQTLIGYMTYAASNTITKAGTTTFGQNRFYATHDLALTCVRTGTSYTYAGGAYSLTLDGVTTDPTGLVAGDILIQKVVQQTLTPVKGRKNDIPFIYQNQLVLGSLSDAQAYISKNSDYDDFAFSSPRVAGEGGLMTLDGNTRAINSLGTQLLVFSGLNSIFAGTYQQITVSTTLAETLTVTKYDVGVNQGALNHECVIPIGSQLAYLTNEVSLRVLTSLQSFSGLNPQTLSNPVKPDFDAATWTGAFGIWYKNTLLFTAPASAQTFMLNFVQDANGKAQRFWNPPQLLPTGAMSSFDVGDGAGMQLYGHSASVAETYKLFDGLSDGQYTNMDVADKLPIHAIAVYAYDHMGKRGLLKTHDEYYVEGEINPNTKDLMFSLNYDFDGTTQVVQRTIDGTDTDILEGSVTNNSLAQSLLAGQPLGGLLTPPANARRFRVNFEMAREDYFEISPRFETNDVDRYWSIIAQGSNATLSPRKATTIKK